MIFSWAAVEFNIQFCVIAEFRRHYNGKTSKFLSRKMRFKEQVNFLLDNDDLTEVERSHIMQHRDDRVKLFHKLTETRFLLSPSDPEQDEKMQNAIKAKKDSDHVRFKVTNKIGFSREVVTEIFKLALDI